MNKRTLDTMSDAIALSSPGGRMSKRAKKQAEERLRKALFDGLELPKRKQPTRAEILRQHAARLRDLANRGMNTKLYNRKAEEAEQEAAQLERATAK